jgi:nucleoid DNA-binding protein
VNKADLVNLLAAETTLSKAKSAEYVDIMFKIICDFMAEHDKVVFANFGTFRKAQRNARKGKHPMTGEPLDIPASLTIAFTPSPKLREKLKPMAPKAAKKKRGPTKRPAAGSAPAPQPAPQVAPVNTAVAVHSA